MFVYICFYVLLLFINIKAELENHMNLRWGLGDGGFHRDIVYDFNVAKNDAWNDEQLLVKQVIPRGLYVNRDQLEDLARLKKIFATVNDFVDTEMAEDVSESHNVYVWVVLNETDNVLSAKIQLPVHVRYHAAQPGGGFRSALISPPEIYSVRDQFLNNNSSNAVTMLPCSRGSQYLCEYTNLPHVIDNQLLEVLIPVGNLDHYNTVLLVTYFVTLGGTIYIYAVVLLSLQKS